MKETVSYKTINLTAKKILSFNHLSTPYLPTQKENKFLLIQLNVRYGTKF